MTIEYCGFERIVDKGAEVYFKSRHIRRPLLLHNEHCTYTYMCTYTLLVYAHYIRLQCALHIHMTGICTLYIPSYTAL